MKYFILTTTLIVVFGGIIFLNTKYNQPVDSVQSVSTEFLDDNVSVDNISTLNELDISEFSDDQLKILEILKREYGKSPTSFDDTVLKYTEGFEESWCADFVSWVFNEANHAYSNQDTGYWRIPGVYTLQEYYIQHNSYYLTNEYSPKFGDVAFYFGETPDGNSSQHVAMVLAVEEKTIITIGGNESNGILQIRADISSSGTKGLEGFGSSSL